MYPRPVHRCPVNEMWIFPVDSPRCEGASRLGRRPHHFMEKLMKTITMMPNFGESEFCI